MGHAFTRCQKRLQPLDQNRGPAGCGSVLGSPEGFPQVVFGHPADRTRSLNAAAADSRFHQAAEIFAESSPELSSMSRYDRPSHRVYMTSFLRDGWQVQFVESDLKTPLPRKLTFSDPEKIRELVRRGEAWGDSESRQMLEHAIDVGRGGVYLRLTPEQYRSLRNPRSGLPKT
jgi:hypothetical protein